MVAIDTKSLEWLSEQGATYALPFGRTKNKFELDWPNKPHSQAEAIKHAKQGGNVGILTGKHSAGIVALDRDVDFAQTIAMLGDLGKTTKIIRSNAPERGKFLYRINGDIPPTTSWKPEGEKHPFAEFLGDNGQRHALCPPSIIDGGSYELVDTEYGIQSITPNELDYIWRLITGGSIYKEVRAQEDAEAEKQANDEYIQNTKQAWTVKTVFEHFNKHQNGSVKDKGETRLLGNGGLLISAKGDVWFDHAGSVGGDALDAWAWCKWGKRIDRKNPKMFWDTLNDMANAKGIAKPEPKRVYTNGNGNPAADSEYTKNEDTSHREDKAIVPEGTTQSKKKIKKSVLAAISPEKTDDTLLSQGAHDEGNAQCVNARHAGEFVQNDAFGWMQYTGTHWTAESGEEMLDRAIVDTLSARIEAALHSGKADYYKDLITKSIPSADKVRGAKYLFKSLVTVPTAKFDTEPDLLNCKNGAINLRTGEVMPHNPDQYLTHCIDFPYQPKADYSAWVTWLTDAVGGNASIASWLQMAVGYSLTGHTREEVLFYLYGQPRSGKGTFTETLLALLGKPLSAEVDFGTFTSVRTGDSQNFDLAPLKPCRIVMASESNSYERFNAAKVKALTGGNDIYCAHKHRSHFNYKPLFKIWLSSNHPVNADPDDDAVWGRIRVIEFPNSHLGTEDKSLKLGMRTPTMLEAVLAWAVEGAMKWYDLGNAGLPELVTSQNIKADQRQALDNVQGWLDECCTTEKSKFTANSMLYLSYERWCKENGIEAKKQKGFSQVLMRKGHESTSTTVDGKTLRGFRGIGLT